MGLVSSLWSAIGREVRVADRELGFRLQAALDPLGQHCAALLLPKSRAGEVALVDERDDVNDNLVLVKDGIHYYRDETRKVRGAGDLDYDDEETACLEDGAIVCR